MELEGLRGGKWGREKEENILVPSGSLCLRPILNYFLPPEVMVPTLAPIPLLCGRNTNLLLSIIRGRYFDLRFLILKSTL